MAGVLSGRVILILQAPYYCSDHLTENALILPRARASGIRPTLLLQAGKRHAPRQTMEEIVAAMQKRAATVGL